MATRLNNGLAICAVVHFDEVAEQVIGLAVAPRCAAGGFRSTVVAIEIACFAYSSSAVENTEAKDELSNDTFYKLQYIPLARRPGVVWNDSGTKL